MSISRNAHRKSTAHATTVFAPPFTFALYAIQGDTSSETSFTSARVFTSLTIVALVAASITSLAQAVPSLAGGAACFARIQRYLEREEKDSQHDALGRAQPSSTSTSMEPPLVRVNPPRTTGVKEEQISLQTVESHGLELRNASFGWSQDSPPTLSDVSCSIPARSLTLILGPVGRGKTTLLRGLLGELPCSRGAAHIQKSSVAYCAQVPWLPNDTIRHIITGERGIDLEDYQTVLEACTLPEDLAQLPRGESTQVGSGGNVLSFGQKQRIVSLSKFGPHRSKLHLLPNSPASMRRGYSTIADCATGTRKSGVR